MSVAAVAGRARAQMTKRWRLFLALYQYEQVTEPTVEMAKEFTIFMAHVRQRRSSAGREGLGDSVAEAAQKTLAQVRRELGVRCRGARSVCARVCSAMRVCVRGLCVVSRAVCLQGDGL